MDSAPKIRKTDLIQAPAEHWIRGKNPSPLIIFLQSSWTFPEKGVLIQKALPENYYMQQNISFFRGKSGLEEQFLTATSTPGRSFESSLRELKGVLEEQKNRPFWIRLHVSDIANQTNAVKELFSLPQTLISVVGQPPVNGAKAAMEASLLPPEIPISKIDDVLEIQFKHYRHLYFQSPFHGPGSSGEQTEYEFNFAADVLARRGGNIPDNLQRTWLYCRDIDNNYEGLVQARRERFLRENLTEQTHYITSTGIEGMSDPFNRLVRMDSFALFGHAPGQIEYMHAPEHLSPTHVYGVTFERGTRIRYGDRSHYYISGTASIDRDGRIVHPEQPEKQTVRMIENVEALMNHHEGALSDLKMIVVYLRDPSDREQIEHILEERLPGSIPRLIVRGSVCRPGWLVEMEAFGINGTGNPKFKELYR